MDLKIFLKYIISYLITCKLSYPQEVLTNNLNKSRGYKYKIPKNNLLGRKYPSLLDCSLRKWMRILGNYQIY